MFPHNWGVFNTIRPNKSIQMASTWLIFKKGLDRSQWYYRLLLELYIKSKLLKMVDFLQKKKMVD